MTKRNWCAPIAITLALTSCRRSAPVDRSVSPATRATSSVSISVSRVSSNIAPEPSSSGRPEWTLATTMREPPYAVPKGVANVVAHVPDRYDDTGKIHLVIFFHGAVQCAAQLAQLGEVVCKPGDKPLGGYGYSARHDDAAKSSLFTVPQFAFFGGGSAGRMIEPGFFPKFVQELVGETFVGGLGAPKTLDDIADVTLIAHSAGFNPVIAILSRDELASKVKNVVLLDSFFAGGEDYYLQWLARQKPEQRRRFVAVHGDTGDSGGHHANMAKRLKPGPFTLAVYPKGSLVDAIRAHDATIAKMPVNHYWMPTMLLAKVIAGLDLPARTVPIPTVTANARVPTPLPFDTTITESLAPEDPQLSNGSFADEFALALKAGESIVITATGGKSLTETCCTVDVALQVFDGDRLVASDDDGAGSFDSKLELTAPRAATYRVRVTTSGSGYKLGPYVLRAARSSEK